MKSFENFLNCFNVLKSAYFESAAKDKIYRMGVVCQFEFTFRLACEALRKILKIYGVDDASTDTPMEILQLGYKFGFINDSAVWLMMLKMRNTSIYIYNKDEVDELIILIRDSFISAFVILQETLENKLREAESDWQ